MDVDHVLLDLDGVVRHFDAERMKRSAVDNGVAPQALIAAFSDPSRLQRLVTGAITRREWLEQVGEAVGSPEAARAMGEDRGVVAPAMMSLLERLGELPVGVSILTNGTNTIDAELMQLGVLHLVDRVFNSYRIGFAKPHRKIYDMVTDALAVAPERIYFTDDLRANVDAARDVGWKAAVFESVAGLEADLRELGVAV